MKAIAAILLLGVFLRHGAHNIFASDRYSPAALFYINGGLWEMTLCGLLLALLSTAHKSLWRNFAMLGCAVGISEGLQIAGCRLAITNISTVPKGANLCDAVTGLPIGGTAYALYFFIFCWILARKPNQ